MRPTVRHVMFPLLLSVLCGGCATMETPATPVGPQSSWEEIRGTPGLVVLAPQIPFGTRGVSVTDVCVSGDTLRAPTAGGGAAEVAVAGRQLWHMIRVGVPAGDFVKPFEISACK